MAKSVLSGNEVTLLMMLSALNTLDGMVAVKPVGLNNEWQQSFDRKSSSCNAEPSGSKIYG